MTILDIARVQAGAQQVDLAKAARVFAAFLVKVLVVLIAAVPFAVAWSLTMFVKICVAASQEGVRQASAQLARGGGS